MVLGIRKLYFFFGLFIIFLLKTVDFNTPEFDPIHAQWQEITTHRYYTNYVNPIQEQINSNVIPSITKVNNVLADKYHVYLSTHVQSLTGKLYSEITNNEKVNSFRAKVEPYTKVTCVYVHRLSKISSLKIKTWTQLTFNKLAIGAIKTQNFIVKSKDQFFTLLNYLKSEYHRLEPIVEAYINDTIIPFLKLVLKKVTYYLNIVSTNTLSFVKKISSSSIQPLYNEYLKHYVDQLFIQVTKYFKLSKIDQVFTLSKKYYRLLKVDLILSCSKDLLTGTIDQASSYFNKKKDLKADEIIVDATSAFIEDEPTTLAETETIRIDETPTNIQTAEETQAIQELVGTENIVPKESEHSVHTSVEPTLADEIEAWKNFIHSKIESLNRNFDNDINTLESSFLSEVQPKVTNLLQNFSKSIHDDFAELKKDIGSINSSAYLLESGEEIEIDSHDNIIEKKVTREDFRAKINAKKVLPGTYADEIFNFTINQIKTLERLVDEERKTIVDIYEEFAEVAINEFSKKMMYSTFAGSFAQLSEDASDAENYQDWKDYIKVKNYLIEQRDVLVSKRQELAKTKSYVSEIQTTLKTLIHEFGSYYAILRAEANLEFQAREEKERTEEQRLETEEIPKTTSTILKYITLSTSDGSLETKETEIEIEISSEEDISDLESNEGDYDVGSIELDSGEAETEAEVKLALQDKVGSSTETPAEPFEETVQQVLSEVGVDETDTAIDDESIVEHQEDESEIEEELEETTASESDITEHQPDKEAITK